MRRTVTDAKTIVVKVGTSTLTHKSGLLNIRRLELLVKTLSDLKNSGKQIVLVTSGAIGVGVGKLALPGRPDDIPGKQAAAAVGQCDLMSHYDQLFGQYGHGVAQILLTRDVIETPHSKLNVKNTFERLLEWGVVPIVNENDTVATEEIESGHGTAFGDNDTLSAMVATLIDADLLIILSDIDGLFTADPRRDSAATLIPVVSEITPEIEALAAGKGSALSKGGMVTKITAARVATKAGIDMVILNGDDPLRLYDLFEGKELGTLFLACR